jgi:hypothetical protein
MISFERISMDHLDGENKAVLGQTNIFQTVPWINFVAETQKAEPVIAALKSEDRIVGYFTGLIIRKYGLRILGSPFRGWGAYFMGFNLMPDILPREALLGLAKFAFEELRCHYLEVVDPGLKTGDWEGLDFDVEFLHWQKIDLTKSEDDLWANMEHNGRNCIRKSIKNGVVIEEASAEKFAEEYFAQYEEVFAKQSLKPPYNLEQVRKLIKHLHPTGNLLLLRAKNKENLCIATGIFLSLNKTAIFWGAASLGKFQILRPNEPLAWFGIKKMKARGIRDLHFGGTGEQYKKKLGCSEIKLPRLMMAKYSILRHFIDFIRSPRGKRFRNWALRRLA